MSWLKHPVVVIDTETTGVSWTTARIVELAVGIWRPWLPVDHSEHVETQSWLVHPGVKIPAEATAVHGITDQMLADAPGFRTVAKQLLALLSDLESPTFCAYHAPYDASVLACEFARAHGTYGTPPLWLEFNGSRPAWIDPLVWAKRLHPYANGKGRYKLGNVAARLGVPAGTAHRAEGDVQTTVNVLRAITEASMEMSADLEMLLRKQSQLVAIQEMEFFDWLMRQQPLPKDL